MLLQCHGFARLGDVVLPHPWEQGGTSCSDARMIRFMITLDQGVDLVWHAFDDIFSGEIYVKKITDLALVCAPDANQHLVGI